VASQSVAQADQRCVVREADARTLVGREGRHGAAREGARTSRCGFLDEEALLRSKSTSSICTLGKFAWGKETGHDYDSPIAERVARAAVADLLEQASDTRIAKSSCRSATIFSRRQRERSTTAGTQVDHDTRFHKMFRAGRALASWMIEACAAVAPVHVPVVPGNHDENAAFTMGVVLEAEFGRDPRVTFDNSQAAEVSPIRQDAPRLHARQGRTDRQAPVTHGARGEG
jgi:hypothetical protein